MIDRWISYYHTIIPLPTQRDAGSTRPSPTKQFRQYSRGRGSFGGDGSRPPPEPGAFEAGGPRLCGPVHCPGAEEGPHLWGHGASS